MLADEYAVRESGAGVVGLDVEVVFGGGAGGDVSEEAEFLGSFGGQGESEVKVEDEDEEGGEGMHFMFWNTRGSESACWDE